MNAYYGEKLSDCMDKSRTGYGEAFTRKVLIPYWFEIVSGIFVGLSMFLIFARKMPIT